MSDNADTPSMKNLYITETVNVRYGIVEVQKNYFAAKICYNYSVIKIYIMIYFRHEIYSSYSIRVYTKLIKL